MYHGMLCVCEINLPLFSCLKEHIRAVNTILVDDQNELYSKSFMRTAYQCVLMKLMKLKCWTAYLDVKTESFTGAEVRNFATFVSEIVACTV